MIHGPKYLVFNRKKKTKIKIASIRMFRYIYDMVKLNRVRNE